MNDDILTEQEAIAMLPDGDDIHTFIQVGPAIIGCDWSRGHVLELIHEEASNNNVRLSGDIAAGMKHGIAVLRDGKDTLFLETENLSNPSA